MKRLIGCGRRLLGGTLMERQAPPTHPCLLYVHYHTPLQVSVELFRGVLEETQAKHVLDMCENI